MYVERLSLYCLVIKRKNLANLFVLIILEAFYDQLLQSRNQKNV